MSCLMILKAYITIEVDIEEYPSPVDGDIASEIKDELTASVYDIDGVELKQINVLGSK